MNKTKIEWADYTWNPIIGCSRGCSWCYASRLNNRFHFIPNFTKPQFFPERLTEPDHAVIPTRRNRIAQVISPTRPVIFVGSMADIFCEPYTRPWVMQIIKVARKNPDKVFMFLTKFPYNYWTHRFPENCWLGTSISTNSFSNQMRIEAISDPLMVPNKNFVSVEPLQSTMAGVDFARIEMVIVGAQTGPNPVIPDPLWLGAINHGQLYLKDNILEHLDSTVHSN